MSLVVSCVVACLSSFRCACTEWNTSKEHFQDERVADHNAVQDSQLYIGIRFPEQLQTCIDGWDMANPNTPPWRGFRKATAAKPPIGKHPQSGLLLKKLLAAVAAEPLAAAAAELMAIRPRCRTPNPTDSCEKLPLFTGFRSTGAVRAAAAEFPAAAEGGRCRTRTAVRHRRILDCQRLSSD